MVFMPPLFKKEQPMYASIRRYQATATVDELVQRVNEGFLPLISQAPGFLAYYVVEAADGMVASISLFETQAGAEASNQLAATWVSENLARMVASPAEVTAGEVRVQHTA
jgi:hypothetical protein